MSEDPRSDYCIYITEISSILSFLLTSDDSFVLKVQVKG
jgi:hypothetical protein